VILVPKVCRGSAGSAALKVHKGKRAKRAKKEILGHKARRGLKGLKEKRVILVLKVHKGKRAKREILVLKVRRDFKVHKVRKGKREIRARMGLFLNWHFGNPLPMIEGLWFAIEEGYGKPSAERKRNLNHPLGIGVAFPWEFLTLRWFQRTLEGLHFVSTPLCGK
jgi:hypothetical protein